VNLPLTSAIRSSADADTPSYSSTLRIGIENVCFLRDIRLGQSHIEDEMPTRLPQAMQIGLSIIHMLCRCLFNG
jgi:hypothetical protein